MRVAKDIAAVEQITRLEALQATVELLSAARAVHTPWERLQSLLTTSLAHYRQQVEACVVRPNFVMPLPPFVRSSSSLLAHLADGPAATSWMLHMHNPAGASRVALLLQHSLLDPEASEPNPNPNPNPKLNPDWIRRPRRISTCRRNCCQKASSLSSCQSKACSNQNRL